MEASPDIRMPPCRGVNIEDVSIGQLQEWLQDGRFTAVDLTECYIERTRRLNSVLKAVLELDPDALDVARERDGERKRAFVRGPLHGIPFLVKDNIATKDKMQTTAGCTSSEVPEDAQVVKLLREAGAVLLGHTNMSEWASMRATYYRGGQSRNPYNLAEHPGDSSSGPATAICQPSGHFTCQILGKSVLKGSRFGMPWKRVWERASSEDSVRVHYTALQALVDRLQASGAEIVKVEISGAEGMVPQDGGWDWDHPSKMGHPEQSEVTVVKVDSYNDIKKYLEGLIVSPHNIRSLEDIIQYNIKHTARECGVLGTHPAWPTGQDSFDKSQAAMGIEDETYKSALKFIRRKTRDEGMDPALSYDGKLLDGLLVPVQADNGVAMQIAAQAGYPMITIPVDVGDDTFHLV